MAKWQLIVRTPNDGAPKGTYTNDPAVFGSGTEDFSSGFRWSWKGGKLIQLEWHGRRMRRDGTSGLSIEKYDLVQLVIEDTPVFYGLVDALPNLRSMGAADGDDQAALERWVAVGAHRKIEEAESDDRRYSGSLDVGFIARTIAFRRLPPGVNFNADKVPDTGRMLSEFYFPARPLSQAFDELKRTLGGGYDWGVDAEGDFFFGEFTGELVLPFSSSLFDPIPEPPGALVTKVVIPITGSPSPQGMTFEGLQTQSKFPEPVVFSYEEPGAFGHSRYNATLIDPGAVKGLDPFIRDPSTGDYFLSWAGIINAANVVDDDPDTYAGCDAAPLGYFLSISETATGIYGAELDYELVEGSEAFMRLELINTVVTGIKYTAELELSPGERGITRIVLPHYFSVETSASWTLIVRVFGSSDAVDELKIYELRPLVLNDDLLTDVAKALIVLPNTELGQVEISERTDPREAPPIPGYIAPVKTITVTGTPGGDLEGEAAEYEWQAGLETGLSTIIRIGRDSASDDARTIKALADKLDAQTSSSLRAYADRRQ